MNPQDFYKGKKILITGGVGSIGSELVKRIHQFHPAIIRILDVNETGLFEIEHEFHSPIIRTLIGDIRDKDRLIMAMDGIDIVFHTSALKHVPLCEYNPFDAVKTNVLGTQNVLEAALINEVEKVINVSTDKAVSPTNVMGATKLLAERLVISANHYRGNKKTIFSSVRFGNVLNSRGSVIPLFFNQIKKGGPVTVTNPEMTRFFMLIGDAVDLILKAGIMALGKEIFILKMPAFRIIDLAEAMTEEYNSDAYSKVPIEIIGTRIGEKLHEDLMSAEEAVCALENDEMYILIPHHLRYEDSVDYSGIYGFERTKDMGFSSQTALIISKEEIRSLLRTLHIN